MERLSIREAWRIFAERLIRVWSVKGAASTDFWSVRDRRIFEEEEEKCCTSNRSSWCDSSTDFLKSSRSKKERSSGVPVEALIAGEVFRAFGGEFRDYLSNKCG
eukprot:TRINITY_DN21157_c0_g1_i2.p1 TRINITY_DN21157_c0_g1~~TRINITY_DN21157_c0_g1_i2.p1  ORF type:complete len:104 (+),score=20.98 TRINITY_DN21157_c0_g1_i2:111-422(+)